ncbi:hypothetical protein GGI15_001310 [Coemansia interrupta]|uniref:DUF3020 domain-containing protein n=1 Tax=Coemansia interrupta TaxID=1126814 RepID=A0A9W8HK72_9FUNG|nr:hypothetical protein GGI15_001310 [Coemansia interrupta]
MNQNPFAFFTADTGAYPQLPDPLGHGTYMDTRSGLMIRDTSLNTSTMSHDSVDSDSNPSTPSKDKRSDHRTPKSKAEVSERMRRWRSENAEKNRLNDLRCRVYRQARIRFGKDPTPEREAWIQSEIFRRLERRRLREAMKGNGSVPAPTAMTSPTSMAMGMGAHVAGGPITRSRSTVHPFPIHMTGQSGGVPEQAMGFPAPPYAMMAGGGLYDSSQPRDMAQQHYGNGTVALHHGHHYPYQQPHQQRDIQNGHEYHQAMHASHQHNGYLAAAHGYAHMQPQQQQHQNQQQQNQNMVHHQSEQQLPSNFIGGPAGSLPSSDIYDSFKLISPLYSGRILPSQPGATPGSTHPSSASLYDSQQQQNYHQHQRLQHNHQQQQQHSHTNYLDQSSFHQSSQQQPSQQQQLSSDYEQTQDQAVGLAVPDTVASQFVSPDQQRPHSLATNSVDAAAAAAVAAVVDLSKSFQLPQGSGQNMYPYYQESAAATWENSASSAETSNGQSHSSPATPPETISSAPSQYTLHAVDSSAYSFVSSPPRESNASVQSQSDAPEISSLAMVNPVANSIVDKTDGADGLAGNSAAEPAVDGNTSSYNASPRPAPSNFFYGYTPSTTSPSLNDVASNLFSLRQVGQTTGNTSITIPGLPNISQEVPAETTAGQQPVSSEQSSAVASLTGVPSNVQF